MLQDDPRCSQSLLRDCLRILDGRRRLRVPIVAHRNSSRIWIWFFEDSLRILWGVVKGLRRTNFWFVFDWLLETWNILWIFLFLFFFSCLLRSVCWDLLGGGIWPHCLQIFFLFLPLFPSFSLSLSLSLSVTISVSLWLFRLNAAYLMKTSSD